MVRLGQVQTKIYDDFHDAFTYSEGWVPSSPAPASEDRYDGTAHGSSVKGTYVDFKSVTSNLRCKVPADESGSTGLVYRCSGPCIVITGCFQSRWTEEKHKC